MREVWKSVACALGLCGDCEDRGCGCDCHKQVPWIPDCSSGPRYGFGQCAVTWHYPAPGEPASVTIDKADPQILVVGLLLDAIAAGRSPFAMLTRTCACSPGARCPHYQGAKLEIRGENRKVIYIIGRPVVLGDLPEPLAWEAEWPD